MNAPLQEIQRKGQEIYETSLKNKLEPKEVGRYVVIEVESGDYFLHDFIDEALKEAKKKYPGKIFYSVRVGYPGVFSFSKVRTYGANSSTSHSPVACKPVLFFTVLQHMLSPTVGSQVLFYA